MLPWLVWDLINLIIDAQSNELLVGLELLRSRYLWDLYFEMLFVFSLGISPVQIHLHSDRLIHIFRVPIFFGLPPPRIVTMYSILFSTRVFMLGLLVNNCNYGTLCALMEQ